MHGTIHQALLCSNGKFTTLTCVSYFSGKAAVVDTATQPASKTASATGTKTNTSLLPAHRPSQPITKGAAQPAVPEAASTGYVSQLSAPVDAVLLCLSKISFELELSKP